MRIKILSTNEIVEGILINKEKSHIPDVYWITVDDGLSTIDIWLCEKFIRTERIFVTYRSDTIEILEE